MALQGMDLEIHDIDIQTDQRGAYGIEGLQIPVLSLESELQAYRMLGRTERADKIEAWLKENRTK